MKVALCCFLLRLFSVSSAEVIRVTIKGENSIAITDENFICATLDWWPNEKCNYNQCPWGNTSILNLVLLFSLFLSLPFNFMIFKSSVRFHLLQDLKNKIFMNAIKGESLFSFFPFFPSFFFSV